MKVDYLVVGAGLTGATIARLLADAGRDVLVVDRRERVGGNVADTVHPSGIRHCLHGPHYFRTSSDRVWEFATRFDRFYEYKARVVAEADGQVYPWPLGASTLRKLVGDDWRPGFTGTPTNFEEASLAMMPRRVYDLFVKDYNEKQWGVPARTLSADLAGRFDVRADDDPHLKPNAKHQGLPVHGYTSWVRNMLHGIPVLTGFDWIRRQDEIHHRKHLFYTGPIDELFGFRFGKLDYRGQKRVDTFIPTDGFFLKEAQVNTPGHDSGPQIRHIDWKRVMDPEHRTGIRGSLVTTETPYSPTDPDQYEYPVPDKKNAILYGLYRDDAAELENVTVCGRLGEFKYLDMDQAIARAMTIAGKVA